MENVIKERKLKRYVDSSDEVYRNIRSMILTGKLQPGQSVVAGNLAKKVGVSRIPVRESLVRLRSEGLLKSEYNKGYKVREYTRHDIINLFEVREMVESFAAKASAERADEQGIKTIRDACEELSLLIKQLSTRRFTIDEFRLREQECDEKFHLSILNASQNEQLATLIHVTHGEHIFVPMDVPATLEYLLDDAKKVYDSHGAVLKAIEMRDGGEAEKAIRVHLTYAREGVLRAFDAGCGRS